MNNNNGWDKILNELIDILREADKFHSDNYIEPCFLTAYQLAVLLYKKNKPLVLRSNCPHNIGGKGEGSYTSLSQFIANSLARDIRSGKAPNIEIEFINISGLEQFSFLDEKGIISQPSNKCFSMFRYKG